MQWMTSGEFWSVLIAAGVGAAVCFLTVARAAPVSEQSFSDPDPKLLRRLSDCEAITSELVAAIGRIEARDKMRRVRAGKPDAPVTQAEPEPAAPTISNLSTAEIRRRIAQRVPIS